MKFKKGRGLVCLALILVMLLPGTVSAAESTGKVVRIGVFEETYNTVNEDGERNGYGYEYLQKIAGYTGWTYQYVKADWSNVFDKLQNGEIDIIGDISYTDERAEQMLFSSIPMAEEKYYIYINRKDTKIDMSDLNSFNGKNVGVFQNNLPETVLNEWEQKNEIQTNHVNISTEEDIVKNLENHKMDCFVSVEEPRWSEMGFSPVVNIGNSEIYFAVNKNRSDLKQELDNAMRRITNDNSFYTDDLYKQYLATQGGAVLSEEEQQWIRQHGTIRMGYVANDSGVSSIDSESGELTGAINDYIDYAKDCLDNQALDFETVEFDSMEKQIEALKNGKIDMIFKVPQNAYYAEQNEMSLTDTVMSIPMLAVTSEEQFDESKENCVAIVGTNLDQKWYVDEFYPNWDIVECKSVNDAKKMVLQGKADCLLIRTAQYRKYLENDKLHGILLENYGKVSFGVNRANKTLLSILNNTLKTMPSSMLTNALTMYENTMSKVTTAEYIKDNLKEVTVLGILLVLFISIILVLLRKSQIAEAKAKEAMQIAESANAAKSNFLFNMSHDIRTPMNAMLGYNQLMKKEITEPKLQHYLEKVEQSGNLLLSIINNVLDMARIESGKMELDENYDQVGVILSEICEAFDVEASKKGICFTYKKQVTHPHIVCDVAKIQKIFMNLIGNAIKYTPAGGSVTVSVEEIPCDQEGFVKIKTQVIDTGIGMSKEYLPTLFDSFSRERNTTDGKVAGTGLGMAIVKEVVDMMGGTIEVESELGKGTRFTIILQHRIADEKYYELKDESEREDKKMTLQGKHVLLAEDNELNAEIAITILEDMGIEVDHVEDGIQCVDRVEQMPAEKYDLILMDIQMPHMDGYKATETIRSLKDKKKANIPIVAMTANAFEEDRKLAFEKGMNEHIAKPIDVEKVEKVILEILSRK